MSGLPRVKLPPVHKSWRVRFRVNIDYIIELEDAISAKLGALQPVVYDSGSGPEDALDVWMDWDEVLEEDLRQLKLQDVTIDINERLGG